eukprot:3849676-Amphidinium_carterae.1
MVLDSEHCYVPFAHQSVWFKAGPPKVSRLKSSHRFQLFSQGGLLGCDRLYAQPFLPQVSLIVL